MSNQTIGEHIASLQLDKNNKKNMQDNNHKQLEH